MGNGPSLRGSNWRLLSALPTIGLNRIYLLADQMGFVPTYYCCVNSLVLQQFADEIREIKSLQCIDWDAGMPALGLPSNRMAYIPAIPSFDFHHNILHGWCPGSTVTFAAMQLAFFLGFRRVLLIGVDHRFGINGPANRVIVSSGDDLSHFASDYFGKGVKWALPDLENSERMYNLARTAFETAGREIVDCTTGGNLKVFPKGRLEELAV
jgi:hypothetical protein